jgi:hypothetical protein
MHMSKIPCHRPYPSRAADGVSVRLSSRVPAELQRVAGYLILPAGGRVRLAGPEVTR